MFVHLIFVIVSLPATHSAKSESFCGMQVREGQIETSILEYSAESRVTEGKRSIDRSQLVGQYSCGDGFGCNLSLDLKLDGKFECIWYGCLGEYAKAQGEWTIDEKGIELHNNVKDGLLKDREIKHLRIAAFQKQLLLLESRDVGTFRGRGPSRSGCLHTKEARKLVEEEGNRRLKELYDEVLKKLPEMKKLKETQPAGQPGQKRDSIRDLLKKSSQRVM